VVVDSLASVLFDEEVFIEGLLSIPARAGGIIPFRKSNFQNYYLEQRRTGKKRRVILKPRQIFASTIILAKNFQDCVTQPGTRVLVMTHNEDATRLMRLTVRQWTQQLEALGLLPTIENDNDALLSFKNTNSFMVFLTAGGKMGARSTAFNRVHLSEVAHYEGNPETMLQGLIPAVPQDGQIDIESTPRGAAGPFHAYYTDAKGEDVDWNAIFWPWYNNPEYMRDVPDRFRLDDKERFVQGQYKLSDRQMAWRQWMEAELKRAARDSGQSGNLFLQEYPEDDISCFIAGVEGVLDSTVLQEMISFIQPPITRFEQWDIWKGPRNGVPYIIGADSSEGKSDYSAAHILDAISLESVARFHMRVAPSEFSKALDVGGKMYNDALMVVETPGPGQVVLDRLQLQFNYNPLYYYEDEIDGRTKDEPGWPQNSKTRNILIDTLQSMTSARGYRIYDERTLRELASLTWRRVGSMRRARAEAAAGSHDDLVFALGLGLVAAPSALRQHRVKMGHSGPRVQIIGQSRYEAEARIQKAGWV